MITKSRADCKFHTIVSSEALTTEEIFSTEGSGLAFKEELCPANGEVIIPDTEIPLQEADSNTATSLTDGHSDVSALPMRVDDHVDSNDCASLESENAESIIVQQTATANCEGTDAQRHQTPRALSNTGATPQHGAIESVVGGRAYTKAELATMDMTELVRLLDSGAIEMDELIEACDEAAARRKAEARRTRDLSDPQVLMAAVRGELGDDEWRRLREASGRLRRGEVPAAEYYTAFKEAFARLDSDGLLEPLLETLPDPAKRSEIRDLHRAAAASAAAAAAAASDDDSDG